MRVLLAVAFLALLALLVEILLAQAFQALLALRLDDLDLLVMMVRVEALHGREASGVVQLVDVDGLAAIETPNHVKEGVLSQAMISHNLQMILIFFNPICIIILDSSSILFKLVLLTFHLS